MPSDGPTELLGSERPKGGIIVHVLRWPPADSSTAGGGSALGPWEGRSGPIQVLWSQFPYRGCNGSSRKRYGRFCHQNPGKVAEPSVSGVYPHPERTIGTLFKTVVFMICNCGCLYSAIGVVRGSNYYREKRGDAWVGCVWGGGGVGIAVPWAGCWGANQWRRQNAANARAQHGHTTFASLVPRPRPAFSRLQYGNAEATRGVWGLLPQKIFGSFELPKSILCLLTQSNKVC